MEAFNDYTYRFFRNDRKVGTYRLQGMEHFRKFI